MEPWSPKASPRKWPHTDGHSLPPSFLEQRAAAGAVDLWVPGRSDGFPPGALEGQLGWRPQPQAHRSQNCPAEAAAPRPTPRLCVRSCGLPWAFGALRCNSARCPPWGGRQRIRETGELMRSRRSEAGPGFIFPVLPAVNMDLKHAWKALRKQTLSGYTNE